MLLGEIHRWLGDVSGGTGPVFRWVWASLVILCVVGMAFLGAEVFQRT